MFIPTAVVCFLLLIGYLLVTLFKIRKNWHFKNDSHYEVCNVERDTNVFPYVLDFIGKIVLPMWFLTVESTSMCAILIVAFIIFIFYSIRTDFNFLYAIVFNIYKVTTDDGIIYTVYSFEDIYYVNSGKYLEVGNGILLQQSK